jgi:hypothetical protein
MKNNRSEMIPMRLVLKGITPLVKIETNELKSN